MSAPPYMKLYWADYHQDTRHLTRDEHGAYFLLLGEAWNRGGYLPDDDAMLARWALATPEEWARLKPIVMAYFRAATKGRWRHKRICDELASYEEVSRKRKAAGKKGGSASRGKGGGNGEANAQALAQQKPTKPEPEPEPDISISPPQRERDGEDPWPARLEEAKAAGGAGIDLTSPAMHTYRDLRALCEPATGEPCEWVEVLDAIRFEAAKAAQKGRPIRTWTWVAERAVGYRDRRLAGLPPPKAAVAARPAPDRIGDDWPDTRWEAALFLWRNEGTWDAKLGPTPDQPDCRVPAHLMRSEPSTLRVVGGAG